MFHEKSVAMPAGILYNDPVSFEARGSLNIIYGGTMIEDRIETSIKWMRLREICRDIAGDGVRVELHASTDLPADMRAAVLRKEYRVDIALNMLYNKSLDDCLDSLAHEMAHIVIGTDGHGEAFEKEWARLRRTMTREYRARELLVKARALARVRMAGLYDKGGRPKSGHVDRVAARVPRTVDKTVAYLHDLIEDTDYGEARLRWTFPRKIADAVMTLTRSDKAEDYMTYIAKIARDPLARRVKLADLDDNLDPRRIIPDKGMAEKLRARYLKAREYLLSFKN